MTLSDLNVNLLVIYQAWCGEKIITMDRAKLVLDDLLHVLLTFKSKTAANKWFKEQDWGETPKLRLNLVNMLWPLRDGAIELWRREMFRKIMR